MSDEQGGEVVEATPEILRRLRADVAELRRGQEQTNGRIDGTNRRLDALEKTVQAGFDGMGRWLETIANALNAERKKELDEIRGRLTAVENRVFRTVRKAKKH